MTTAPTRQRTWLSQPHHDGSGRYVSNQCPASATASTCSSGCRSRPGSRPSTCAPRPTARRPSPSRAGPHDSHRRLVARDADLPQPRHELPLPAHRRADEVPVAQRDRRPRARRARRERLPSRRARRARRRRGRWVRSSTRSSPTASPAQGAPTGTRRPTGPIPAAWSDPVDLSAKGVAHQLYGGDLDGITEHLDHLESLGVDVVYLTPFFPARSNHRYDASSFEQIDPLLGGAPALRRLSTAATSAAARSWATSRRTTRATPTSGSSRPGRTGKRRSGTTTSGRTATTSPGSACRPCPSSTTSTPPCATRIFEDPQGVVRKWLGRSGGLDGWRVDVANMTGRWRDTDVNHDVARQMRDVMGRVAPDALLVGEHFHDYTPDMPGDGWHGVMNYAGFCKPAWTWLRRSRRTRASSAPRCRCRCSTRVRRGDDARLHVARSPGSRSSTPSTSSGRTTCRASARLVGRDAASVEAAAGLLFTFPSMPMMTYGDEIGMEGTFGEDGRRPMPWDENHWDAETLAVYRGLIAARRRLGRPAARWAALGARRGRRHGLPAARRSTRWPSSTCARAAHEPCRPRPRHLAGIENGSSGYGRARRGSGAAVTLSAARPRVRIWTWRHT